MQNCAIGIRNIHCHQAVTLKDVSPSAAVCHRGRANRLNITCNFEKARRISLNCVQNSWRYVVNTLKTNVHPSRTFAKYNEIKPCNQDMTNGVRTTDTSQSTLAKLNLSNLFMFDTFVVDSTTSSSEHEERMHMAHDHANTQIMCIHCIVVCPASFMFVRCLMT